MDEDFMADPEALFYWKSEASSGHGALDDFGVHPLSLIWTLFGGVRRVCGHMSRALSRIARCTAAAAASVETHDIATALIELDNGASGVIALNRSAWGRKGRLFIQIFGSRGTIAFDQERMNELQLYVAESGERKGSAPSWQGRSIPLTTIHPRARAMGSASTISRSSSAAN